MLSTNGTLNIKWRRIESKRLNYNLHLIASDLGWELTIRSKHCRQTVCEHGNNFGWCSWESDEYWFIHVEHVKKCSVKSLALILIVSTNVEPISIDLHIWSL
jgi:hypothetical protein